MDRTATIERINDKATARMLIQTGIPKMILVRVATNVVPTSNPPIHQVLGMLCPAISALSKALGTLSARMKVFTTRPNW